MKAFLELELFSEDTRAMAKLYSNIADCIVPGLGGMVIGTIPPSSWVAEITGFDEKYKYARKFLKPKKDYSRANSKGSRGVFAEYIIESRKIYEVKASLTWRRIERYFCTVDEEGEIIKLEESEVIECLKSRSE